MFAGWYRRDSGPGAFRDQAIALLSTSQVYRAGHVFFMKSVWSCSLGFLTFVLSGFVKIYPPPQLPRDYRPVHYFRPVVAPTSENAHLLQVLSESSGKAGQDTGTHSRHQLNASKRGELLGEMPVQGTYNAGDWTCYPVGFAVSPDAPGMHSVSAGCRSHAMDYKQHVKVYTDFIIIIGWW